MPIDLNYFDWIWQQINIKLLLFITLNCTMHSEIFQQSLSVVIEG